MDFHGTPYGKFAETLPRIGLIFTLDSQFSEAVWYGRGKDECYADRCEHCNFGLYREKITNINFHYDIPQECGTRIDTHFLKIGEVSIVGSERFAFSYHDFTLSNLITARHRNELHKASKNYLYIDYAMRGLGSLSCGPDPEECYELRAHEFRFACMLVPCAEEKDLLELSRKRFTAVTEKLSDTHKYDINNICENSNDFLECDK